MPEILFATNLKAKKNKNPSVLGMKHVTILSNISHYHKVLMIFVLLLVVIKEIKWCVQDTSYASDSADYASNTGSMLPMSTEQTICSDSSMSAEGIRYHVLVRRVLPWRYISKKWDSHKPNLQ